MNSSNFRFILDLHSTQSQISIPVTKGDTARVWYISLSDGGLPYTIADGCLAVMEIKRPTGTYLQAFCPIMNNTTIKYDFSQNEITRNTAAVDGIHECSVTLLNSDGNTIGSPRFTMVVSEKVVNSDDINISDEDKSFIDSTMRLVAGWTSEENARKNNEAARDTAEKTREINENQRLAAEEERNVAETKRNVAETNRSQAEIERREAEEDRKETLKKIQTALARGDFYPIYSTIALPYSAWQGAQDKYYQVVTIAGVTAKSKVDLLPNDEQVIKFRENGVCFVTENNGGTVTVYAIGNKPAENYTMNICITEVRA